MLMYTHEAVRERSTWGVCGYYQWIFHNLQHVEHWNYRSALFRNLIYIAAEDLNNALKIYFICSCGVLICCVCVWVCVCGVCEYECVSVSVWCVCVCVCVIVCVYECVSVCECVVCVCEHECVSL